METNQEYIYSIIAKKLTGTISDEEVVILNRWLAGNKQNLNEYSDILFIWEKSASLSFPTMIKIEKGLKMVHSRTIRKRIRAASLKLVWQVAAVLVLSILFSSLYNYFFFNDSSVNSYFEEVSAAYGTQNKVELPDGSVVLLNSGSTLRFPNRFVNHGDRRIELKGEGYFKVAKDTEHPFIVKVNSLEVKALGTEFNVRAYDPDEKIDVFLLEGKVAISSDFRDKSKQTMVLEPSQMAHYDAVINSMSKKTITNPARYVGWIEGKIVFNDDPIQEVKETLENWYNVDIRIKDEKLSKYRFTGTFINESLDEILNTLSLTSPMGVESVPARQADGKNTKRTVILKMR